MPKTNLKAGQSAEVWGAEARASRFMQTDTHQSQTVQIQFQLGGHGAWTTLQKITTAGYFDVHMKFPASGICGSPDTYPATDLFLPRGRRWVPRSTADNQGHHLSNDPQESSGHCRRGIGRRAHRGY